MRVSRADIQRVADLAELAIDDAAAAALEEQLSRILDYVAQLQQLPDEPDERAETRAVRLREDVVAPDPLAIAPVDFAPAMKQQLFVVPRLAELSGGDDA